MNLQQPSFQQSSIAEADTVAAPNLNLDVSNISIMPTISNSTSHHKTNPLRHSTGTMMAPPSTCSNNDSQEPQQLDLSLSDLAAVVKPRRTTEGCKIRRDSGVISCTTMEDASNQTAATVNSSYNHHSSSCFSNSFSRQRRRSSSSRNSHHLTMIPSDDTMDFSDGSEHVLLPPSRRRGSSLNDLAIDSSMNNSSSRSNLSHSSSTSRLRNLHGIRRRRSDPVTRRWREQCSRLYKEHVLDSCPEQQLQLQLQSPQEEGEEVPPSTLLVTCHVGSNHRIQAQQQQHQVRAANKIQSWMRAVLSCQRLRQRRPRQRRQAILVQPQGDQRHDPEQS